MTGDWTRQDEITSDRVRKALDWGDRMTAIVNGTTDDDWDVLVPMIDTDRFVRRGNERDQELRWPAYRELLVQWKAVGGIYDKTLFRASQAGDVVYLDLDERSERPDGTVNTLRSISIYAFDDQDRIVSVDVCMGFHQAG
ncbi:hypothetical protein [Novosphingobium sp. M1R2S20]|uniref:SnoaL-like protein n=1 Tax=Novosphingobium rhizovicinum TaxID=3228928 RepID=A0ABV3REQ9_9SPHN